MSSRTLRADSLNPIHFFNFIKRLIARKYIENEVYVRRIISALYFSLFNYWAAKKYSQRTRGGGPLQDRFKYRKFHEELLSKNLDREIASLYIYRVASDHYILNPTIIRIYNEEMIKLIGEKLKININRYSLKKAMESAEEILKKI